MIASLEDTTTMGDGENDVSMFKVSGVSIGIQLPQHVKVIKHVKNIEKHLGISNKYGRKVNNYDEH